MDFTDVRTLKKTARWAGVFYLMIIIAGIFAEGAVREALIVSDDVVATAGNLRSAPLLFRFSIAADLIMIASDVVIGILFFYLFKSVNELISLMAAFFRLVQASALAINLLMVLLALEFLSGGALYKNFDAAQLDSLALIFLKGHKIGYKLALVFFSISLLLQAYLIFRSAHFPNLLGALLILASAGYCLDNFATFLMPNYSEYADVFGLVVFVSAVIGELSFCLWLLIKGVKDS